MRKSVIIPVMFLVLIFSPISAAAYNAPAYKVNDQFKPERSKVKENTFVLDCSSHDLNNDGIEEEIFLIGCKKDGAASALSEDIKVAVFDGKSRKYNFYSIGELNSAHGGRFFIGDFNRDGQCDILIVTYNDGSSGGSNYSLMTFRKGKAHHLFNQKDFSKGLSFDVNYKDDLKANIYSKDLDRFYTIDLSSRKYTYVDTGIYSKDGKLLKETKGEVLSLSELQPVDIDKDGIYELKAMQRIIGICNIDTLGYVKAIWRLENSTMKLVSVEVIPSAKPGSLQKIQRVMPVFSRQQAQ